MNSRDIRSSFLDYFKRQGHTIVPSAPLVPGDDPTLLFTNAGMNQFKDAFLGREKRAYTRATTSQKCMRVSGKHNDLDNVGPSLRHHTFFEMLGNFSFGDYFKKEAIPFAWELLTDDVEAGAGAAVPDDLQGRGGHSPRRRSARDLDEARARAIGSPSSGWPRTSGRWAKPARAAGARRFTTSAANTSPCEEERRGRTCLGIDCSCDRFVEVWNNVFMEFDRQADGTLTPLPAPSIDTGMGLERITAVIQGKIANYDTDLFTPILTAIGDRAGRRYGATLDEPGDVSMRVIADHLRAMTFLIADGVVPSNEWRGYVLRKIMRRAMRHGKKLGFVEPVLLHVRRRARRRDGRRLSRAPRRARQHRARRPQRGGSIRRGADGRAAPDRGSPRSRRRRVARRARRGRVPALRLARRAARLHGGSRQPASADDRPRGLTSGRWKASARRRAPEARSRARKEPSRLTMRRRPRARARRGRRSVRGLRLDDRSGNDHRRALRRDAARRSTRSRPGAKGYIALARTPFYLESGGQVSDSGRILGADGSVATVERLTRPSQARPRLHLSRVESGAFRRGQIVTAEVADEIRDATRRNHTATHLLHAALRQVLGPHVKQAGSLVAPDRLRFDFVHVAAVTRDELLRIERIVNEQIVRNTPVAHRGQVDRGGDRARRDGALRREVRRPRPRRLDSGLQHGALRRHARPRDRRHRPVRRDRGERRRGGRSAHRSGDRRRCGRMGAAAAAVARRASSPLSTRLARRASTPCIGCSPRASGSRAKSTS